MINAKGLIGALFFVGLFFVEATLAQTCAVRPSGIGAWYRAENDTVDFAFGNNGTL